MLNILLPNLNSHRVVPQNNVKTNARYSGLSLYEFELCDMILKSLDAYYTITRIHLRTNVSYLSHHRIIHEGTVLSSNKYTYDVRDLNYVCLFSFVFFIFPKRWKFQIHRNYIHRVFPTFLFLFLSLVMFYCVITERCR